MLVDKKEDARFFKKSEYDSSGALQDAVRNFLDGEWGVPKTSEYQFFASKEFIFVKDSKVIDNK
jgi:hypothetical protein